MAKKIPMRMCVSCKERFAKKDLIRIVASADGSVQVDPTGRLPGRGAYVCHNPECMKKAVEHSQFDRGLHRKVDPDTIRPELDKMKEADPKA
ncbi:MAG: YlxR family protein [Clostridiales bacterium]|nr:YlxR family protein [Clostridiales bacterium]MBR6254434.1 YlxR family protein [Clostridiales bacterium]MCR5274298.1 YlxR family protein [Clostridiales bacterium]